MVLKPTYINTIILRGLLIFSLNLLLYFPVFGNASIIDSLLTELKQVEEDTQKILLFLDISWEYHNSNPQQTIVYAQRAFDLSRVINYKKGEASSLNHLGIGYDIKGDLKEAMSYYQAALDVAKELKDDKKIRSYLNNVGLICQRQGDYNKAMECFHKALDMVDESNSKDQATASILLNNIGIIHSGENRFEKALTYFEQSLKIERKLNNALGISMALTNIGEQYSKLGKNTKALICYKEALTLSESIEDIVGQAILLSNMGEIHVENGLLDLAEEYFPKALELTRKTGDKGTAVTILNNIAKLKRKKGEYQSAIRYANEGLQMAKEMGDKESVKEIFETLAENYVEVNDFQKAYEYKNLVEQAKDSLYSAEKSKQILELSTRYETQRKETENQLLKEQQAKNQAIIKQRTIIGWAIAITLVLMSIIAFILFSRNREKNRYSQRLEDEVANRTSELEDSNAKLLNSNKELERFAYIASHDLKEPLRNIMSFTRLLERRLPDQIGSDEDIAEYMSYIVNNTKQMHQLIEDVLEFSRIENVNQESEFVELKDLIANVTSVISSTLKERNVIMKIGDLPRVKANSSQLFLVLKNLIENGIKYNESEKPEIWIYSKVRKGMHEITIADNGIGIKEEYHKRIFGMFKRLHNREEYQGSGLGLSICNKVIQKLGGTITVDSKEGQGSKFTFSIPVMEDKKRQPEEAILLSDKPLNLSEV